MLDAITRFVFTIINAIANIFTGFILGVFELMIPELTIPFAKVSAFFNDYVWNILFWIRRVAVNVMCFPNDLFHFLIGIYSVKILLTEGARIIIFIMNIYKTWKGTYTRDLTTTIFGYGDQEYRGWYSIE